VTGTSGGIHSDFFSHGKSPLYFFAATANIFQYVLDTLLVDYPHTFARYPQGHKTLL